LALSALWVEIGLPLNACLIEGAFPEDNLASADAKLSRWSISFQHSGPFIWIVMGEILSIGKKAVDDGNLTQNLASRAQMTNAIDAGARCIASSISDRDYCTGTVGFRSKAAIAECIAIANRYRAAASIDHRE
jgi:hypothetical protein